MCRNIKQLRRPDRPPTDEELHDAALQFVRKLTGYRTPSRANQEAFDAAVARVAVVTRDLFDNLVVRQVRVVGSSPSPVPLHRPNKYPG